MEIITLERLVHVGKMDITRKNKGSLEGAGLSVSLCPSAWSKLARVEGCPHLLEKTGGKFLLATTLTQEDKETIAEWGLLHGYVERAVSYVISYYDDEFEEDMERVYETREEAELESDEDDEIEERLGSLYATEKMVDAIGEKPPLLLVFDWLTTLFAEALGFDGVYWKDTFDVSRLSAPRGVISNTKLKEWSVKVLEESDHFWELPEDEENYYPEDDECDWTKKGIAFHSWVSRKGA